MAVISIPYNEPVIVGGPAFRAVLDPLIEALPDGEDRDEVIQARALKGLLFEFMPEEQAARIAAVLIHVAAELRVKLSSKQGATEWDLGVANWLSTLEMQLQDLVE